MITTKTELQDGRGKLFYFFMWTCLVLAALCICLVIAIILLRSHFTASDVDVAEGIVSYAVDVTSQSDSDMEQASKPVSQPWELDYRLPSDTDPIHYDIFLHPDLSNSTFNGKVIIQIHVKKPRYFLVVNTKHLDIYDTRLTEVVALENESDNFKKKRAGEEREIKIEDAFEYKPNEFWVIVIKNNTELQPGIYNLHLQFRGSLNGKIVGFYSSTYTDSKTQEKRFV
jgi:hypothetical protein